MKCFGLVIKFTVSGRRKPVKRLVSKKGMELKWVGGGNKKREENFTKKKYEKKCEANSMYSGGQKVIHLLEKGQLLGSKEMR